MVPIALEHSISAIRGAASFLRMDDFAIIGGGAMDLAIIIIGAPGGGGGAIAIAIIGFLIRISSYSFSLLLRAFSSMISCWTSNS